MIQLRASIFLGFVFFTNNSFANYIKLADILNHQFKNEKQKEINQSKVKFEILQNSVLKSDWLLDLNSSVEKKLDITEVLTGRADNVTTSLPWVTRLKQNTPYGLTVNLEYYKELDSPQFNNFFQDEKYRGSLEFSLIKDFVGKESRRIRNTNTNASGLFEKKVKIDLCADLSKKFITASAAQEKLRLVESALKDSEASLKKLKKAVRRGALHRSSQDSVSIDVSSLRAEFIALQKELQNAATELQQVAGLNFGLRGVENLSDPVFKADESLFYLDVAILEYELTKYESQLSQLKINSAQDLYVYGGYESSNFSQDTIEIEGQTKFGFVGVQAQFKFGDSAFQSEIKKLKAASEVKKSEINYARPAFKSKEKTYRTSLEASEKAFKDMKRGLSKGIDLERKAYKNFYNGKIKYFEFFSTRNQVLAFRKSVVDSKTNFWNTYVDYLSLKGNESGLCLNGGVL